MLTQEDLPEGFSKFDFRDPKIWREADGTYSVVTVCRAEDGSGAAALFQSKDGFDWHFVTVLERCNNQYGKMWGGRQRQIPQRADPRIYIRYRQRSQAGDACKRRYHSGGRDRVRR